ncbi:MAG TPA: hypothetical protein VLK25_11355 [Allosphingosinicella sp.]|nr:hypothetical protein [Allosphingosinicella sp.]
MSALLRAAALLAVLVAAPAALAQDGAQANPESNVIVTGERDREQAVRDFVGALTAGPMNGQLSRFEEAICPAAFGLSAPMRAAVEARMRVVATAAGLEVGGARCTPNVLLMVTRDKQALIRAIARRSPQYFGEERENRAARIAAQPGAASAWHAEERRNADGRALPMQGGFAVNQTSGSASRLAASGRRAFIAAAVVVESEALVGLSPTQLADYALMRALARTDPGRLDAAGPPTILTALDAPPGSEVPLSMTRWDLGFLRGLYAAQDNLYATAHRGQIARSLETELQQPDETGD